MNVSENSTVLDFRDSRFTYIREYYDGKYGMDHQLIKLIEEVGECLAAYARIAAAACRGESACIPDIIEFQSEIADVLVLLGQYVEKRKAVDSGVLTYSDEFPSAPIILSDILDCTLYEIEGLNEEDETLAEMAAPYAITLLSVAKHLGALPGLSKHIDYKLDRQIERIKEESNLDKGQLN